MKNCHATHSALATIMIAIMQQIATFPQDAASFHGADKAYDTADHVANLRAINVTPHVTQNQAITATGKHRRCAIDARTTRHEGYGMSQSRRAMIECIFGWGKQHGTLRKTKHRSLARVAADFLLNLVEYNLIRIPKLVAA
jgi:hypothetical protein